MSAPHSAPTAADADVEALLGGSPYRGYAYAYPHKTAYRPLDPPVPLDAAWADERRDALFLYLHVPFCEMRCGYCNLFTRAGAGPDRVARYLDALRRQAAHVRPALGAAAFARFALGGGTPTFLDPDALATLLDVAEAEMGVDLAAIPGSVEVSPGTVDRAKLALLVGRGVDRISIGVETFDDAEAAAVHRPQRREEVERALTLLRASGVPTLNIDLIYGLPGQTVASWLGSIRAALAYRPEELFLYPLYVRPLTALGKAGRAWDDQRLACYRAGRDFLQAQGYEQVSMRLFRRADAPRDPGPPYRCQEDGMVGLGCGARSYTRALHYATEYAVGAHGVRAILDAYIDRPGPAFAVADFGCRLDPDDQRRRHAIQSLLIRPGLDRAAYTRRFGADVLDDLPQITILEEFGLIERCGDRLAPTAAGLERADAIGPWLYSGRVRRAMEEHAWR